MSLLLGQVPLLYRWLMIAALVAAVFGYGYLKGHEAGTEKGDKFIAVTEALGKVQADHAKAVNVQQTANLKQVTHDLNQNLKAAGDVAVANYRARYGMQQCSGSGAVPATPGDNQGHAGSPSESMAVGPEFIQACAHDAALLDAWQYWASMNNIPVEP